MVASQPWQIIVTRQAAKEARFLAAAKLKAKTEALVGILMENPFQNPPPYEKLDGDLKGYYSRRINLQHRLVYEIDEAAKIVKIIRMWTHYE